MVDKIEPAETEKEYRKRIQDVFEQLENALEAVDPDLIECEQSLGSMTLTFSDGARCILSAQPSVRQLWLALARDGTAYHFNYDPRLGQWHDDKGKGVELTQFLESYLSRVLGGKLVLKPL